MKKLPSLQKKAYILAALLILLFLLSAGDLLLKHLISANSSKELTAEIYQNGILIKTVPLYGFDTPYEFTVYGENGSYNTVLVKPGAIGIISASCPNNVCVHQGISSHALMPVTCLPNRIVIRVIDDDTLQTDAVTYCYRRITCSFPYKN